MFWDAGFGYSMISFRILEPLFDMPANGPVTIINLLRHIMELVFHQQK